MGWRDRGCWPAISRSYPGAITERRFRSVATTCNAIRPTRRTIVRTVGEHDHRVTTASGSPVRGRCSTRGTGPRGGEFRIQLSLLVRRWGKLSRCSGCHPDPIRRFGMSTPPLEQVRAPVRSLDLVLHDMRERRLDDLARMVRLLCRPVPERRPEPVGHCPTRFCWSNWRSCQNGSAWRSDQYKQVPAGTAQAPTKPCYLRPLVNERVDESGAELPDLGQTFVRRRRIAMPRLVVKPSKQPAIVLGAYPLYARQVRYYLSSMDGVTCFTSWASAVAVSVIRLPNTASMISRSLLSLMFLGTVRCRRFLGD